MHVCWPVKILFSAAICWLKYTWQKSFKTMVLLWGNEKKRCFTYFISVKFVIIFISAILNRLLRLPCFRNVFNARPQLQNGWRNAHLITSPRAYVVGSGNNKNVILSPLGARGAAKYVFLSSHVRGPSIMTKNAFEFGNFFPSFDLELSFRIYSSVSTGKRADSVMLRHSIGYREWRNTRPF